MPNKIKKIGFNLLSLIIATVFLSLTARAATDIGIENPLKFETVDQVSTSVQEYLLYLVGGIAIVFIAISGILYIVGGATQNDNLISLSKKALIGAIVGLIIVVGAKIILDELYYIIAGQSKDLTQLSASQIVLRIINFLLAIVGTLFLISMLVGGVWYFMGGVDESKVELGNKTLTASLIGITIALSALLVIRQVEKIIGGGGAQPTGYLMENHKTLKNRPAINIFS